MANGAVNEWQDIAHPAQDEWQDVSAPPAQQESFGQGVIRNTLGAIAGTAGALGHAAVDASQPTPFGEAVAGAATPGGPLMYEFAKRILPGMLQAHEEQIKKARGAYHRGDYVEAAGHLLGGLIPGVGPMAANAGDTIGGTLTPPAYDKYGNIVKPGTGQAPNVGGGLGEAVGAILPSAIGAVARPVAGAIADRLANSKIPSTLEESAAKQYEQVLAPTTKGNKFLAAKKVAPGLIQRGVGALSLKGLAQKTAAKAQEFGQRIGEAYEGLPDDAAIPLAEVEARIDQAVKDSLTAGGTSASPVTDSAIALAQDLKSRLRSVAENAMPEPGPVRGLLERPPLVTDAPADTSAVTAVEPGRGVARVPKGQPQGGRMFRYYTGDANEPLTPEVLSPDHYAAPSGNQPATSFAPQTAGTPPQNLMVRVGDARRFRQIWDDVAAAAGRYNGADLADYAKGSVHGMAADAIRAVLAEQFPDIADLNHEYTFWKNAAKVVSDTLNRKVGQAKPLGVKMAQAAGTGVGFATAGVRGAMAGREALGALEAAMTSPAWRTVSSLAKDRLAKSIASGNRAATEYYIKQIVAATQANQGISAGTQPALAPAQTAK